MPKRIIPFFLLLAALLCPNWAFAQTVVVGKAALTAASTTDAGCTSTSCLIVSLNAPTIQGAGSAVITIGSATFSGTALFRLSGDGGATYKTASSTDATPISSATGSGNWQFNVGAYTNLMIRINPYTSGTINVTVTVSPAASAKNGGSGGSTVSSFNTRTGAVTPAPGDYTCAQVTNCDNTAKYIIGATDAALTNSIVWPTLAASADIPPTSPNAMNDEFDGQSVLNTSLWTWLAQGSATATFANDHLILTSDTTSLQIRAIYQSAPATPWTVITKVSLMTGNASGSWQSGVAGIFLEDSVAGRYMWFGPRMNTSSGIMEVMTATGQASGFSPAVSSSATLSEPPPEMCLKIQDDGTNLNFSYSMNCTAYSQFYSASRTAFLTNGANRVGLEVANYSGGAQFPLASFDYFRRTQ